MEQQQKNAMVLAQWLLEQPYVKKVYYVGLATHSDYKVMQRQCRGFGSMISFELDSIDTVKRLLQRINIIQYAESLGGVESLITYPMTQTHADVPDVVRREKGINELLLRLSVGIEDVTNLIDDLHQALAETSIDER